MFDKKKLDEDAVKMAKRGEFIADVIADCKDVLYSMLLQLWKEVYTNKDIPMRHWLDRFQLNLKKVVSYEDDVFETVIGKYMRKRHTLTALHEALVLSGEIYHKENLHVKKDNVLLVNYLRECLTYAARDLWYKPFYMFYITHKKEQTKDSKEALDKLITNSIKLVLRQQVNELVIAQKTIMEKQTQMVDIKSDEEDDSSSVISSDSSDTFSEVSSGSDGGDDDGDGEDARSHHSRGDDKDTKSVGVGSVKSVVIGEKPEFSRRPSFGIDPQTGALTPTKALSRAPSVTSIASKPILDDRDGSEDLFIPRSNKMITAIDLEQVNKKSVKTTDHDKDGEEEEQSKAEYKTIGSESDGEEIEEKKVVVSAKKTFSNTYYRPNPKLEQKLKNRDKKKGTASKKQK